MTDRDAQYDNMLNDVYPDLTIAGYAYLTADALYRLDPTAYRCGLSDYRDSLCSDGEHGDDDELGRCEWCGTPRTEFEAGAE